MEPLTRGLVGAGFDFAKKQWTSTQDTFRAVGHANRETRQKLEVIDGNLERMLREIENRNEEDSERYSSILKECERLKEKTEESKAKVKKWKRPLGVLSFVLNLRAVVEESKKIVDDLDTHWRLMDDALALTHVKQTQEVLTRLQSVQESVKGITTLSEDSIQDIAKAVRMEITRELSKVTGIPLSADGDLAKVIPTLDPKIVSKIEDYFNLNTLYAKQFDKTLDTSTIQIFGEKPDYTGLSDIWLARYLGRPAVVKKLKIGPNSEINTVLRRVQTEAKTWEQLEHPNIIGYYGLAMPAHDVPWMVCEYAENGNILEYLKKKPDADRIELVRSPPDLKDGGMSLTPAVAVGRFAHALHTYGSTPCLRLGAARALEYLHTFEKNGKSEPLVHGDPKATHILVDAKGTPRLCDFAFTYSPWDAESLVSYSRNPVRWWRSPEALGDEDDCGKASRETDVYSFAMAIFQVLSDGRAPFEVSGDIVFIKEMMRNDLRWRLPETEVGKKWFPDENSALWRFLHRCWNRTPSERPPIQDVIKVLEDLKPKPFSPSETSVAADSDATAIESKEAVDSLPEKLSTVAERPRLFRRMLARLTALAAW